MTALFLLVMDHSGAQDEPTNLRAQIGLTVHYSNPTVTNSNFRSTHAVLAQNAPEKKLFLLMESDVICDKVSTVSRAQSSFDSTRFIPDIWSNQTHS